LIQRSTFVFNFCISPFTIRSDFIGIRRSRRHYFLAGIRLRFFTAGGGITNGVSETSEELPLTSLKI
jgi:hypothetical protein